ncbi:MAG: DUF4198 domain-containing protein [Terriglobia bacterium]
MKRVVSMACGVVLGVLAVWAHDTWLVPEAFFVAPNSRIRVALNTSEDFPKPEVAPTPDRIASFFVQGSARTPVRGYRVEGNSLVAEVGVGLAGHYIVAAATHPRLLVLPHDDFNTYLREEGLAHILEARQQRSETHAPGQESYRKLAKLILCAGEPADENFRQPVGYRVEIVPLESPCRLRAGDSLPVQVLFDGAPLAGVSVGAGYAGVHGHDYPVWVKTDAAGRARIRVDRSGAWFVRALHMIPAAGIPDADWESFFSTLTFAVR